MKDFLKIKKKILKKCKEKGIIIVSYNIYTNQNLVNNNINIIVSVNNIQILSNIIKQLFENIILFQEKKNDSNIILTILFFNSNNDKKKYLFLQKYNKHQLLGEKLNLFFFDYHNSKLPFFTKFFLNIINLFKKKIKNSLCIDNEYIEIHTPSLYKIDLWKKTRSL